MFEAEGSAGGLADILQAGIAEVFGFDVPILVLEEMALRAVLDGCPFPRDAGKAVHAFLCYETPQVDMDKVEALRAPTERLEIVGKTVWLYAPDGIGRSKLAERLDVGVEVTARNLNTITKMVAMLDD